MPLAETELEIHQVRKLIQCVREQQTSSIDKLIELGIPNLVNYQDPGNGCTALHVAVTVNLENIVSQLLEHGANGNIQDNEGCTALMRACEHGHCQSLEALSMKALSLQTSDKNGLKAVFYCLHPTNRHLKCLSFLLEYGADPNTKSADGVPVLFAACKGGFDKHVECLLDKGADPNARDPGSDKPAVVVASEGKHHSCLRLLAVGGANLNAPYGETKLTALHRAAILGYFECLQVLSAYGADFSVTSKTGDNALHCCTLAYKLLCIRFLGQRSESPLFKSC
jgi:ankyrin repeat protein